MTAPNTSPSCRIIGNMGDNHNGDLNLAKQLANIAISAGCDGIVLPQRRASSCFTKESLLQPVANGPDGYTTRGETLQALELPEESIRELRDLCRGHLDFIGAPYDLESFAVIQSAQPDAYQVEPPVLGHTPLLEAMAATGLPVYLVAGMCTEEDIDVAVRSLGRGSLTLLHCVYAEGLSPQDTALWYIPWLKRKFDLPMGYMGFEGGISTAVAAFALGAGTIEKTFTSDRYLPGATQATSLDRDELRELVRCLRGVEAAMTGSPPRLLMPGELASADNHLASLVAAYDLAAGVVLEESMLTVKLAANGVQPRLIGHLLGRRLAYDMPADAPLSFGVMEA